MSSLGKLPKLSDVTYALKPLAGKYFELGTYLELEHEQLKAIESEHKGNQSRCLNETIYLWQQNNTTGECSWSTLADAVKMVGGHDKLVGELKERDKDLMQADSKPKMLHHPSTERASDSGYLSAVQRRDSTQTRPQRRATDSSEDESGYSSKSELNDTEDSSGSEAECFELTPGCGCTGKKPCSLYTLCAGGCPNPTRKRVPILRKKSKGSAESSQGEIPFEDEHDFEDYEERTKEIQKSFGIFVCKTSHLFKGSNVTIRELNLYLQGAYPVMKPRMKELSEATHFEDFFRIIVDQACSWFDYGIIKDLILCFCASARSCLDEYEARFKSYAEQRLPKGMKHIEVGGGGRRGGRQLVIKIDREWEDVTFSDLDKIRGTFASILGPDIRRSDLYLADIREGCIMMTFMITKELAERLFPSRSCLDPSQVKSLKDKGVLSVMCGSFCWRAASNNKCDRAQPEVKAKEMPQNSFGWKSKIFDIRVGMTVMLLLAMVFTGFCGTLMCSMQAQVSSDHTQAVIFTLRDHNSSFSGSSGPMNARPQSYVYSGCNTYNFATKVTRRRNVTNCTDSSDHGQANHEGPTSPRRKQVYDMMLGNDSIDSNSSYKYSNSLNISRELEPIELMCGIRAGRLISSYHIRRSVYRVRIAVKKHGKNRDDFEWILDQDILCSGGNVTLFVGDMHATDADSRSITYCVHDTATDEVCCSDTIDDNCITTTARRLAFSSITHTWHNSFHELTTNCGDQKAEADSNYSVENATTDKECKLKQNPLDKANSIYNLINQETQHKLKQNHLDINEHKHGTY